MVIYWLQQARDSLREIYKFYKATAGKEVAEKIRTEIYQETRYLLIFPTIGSREEGTPYRYLIKRHCKIFYSIRKERMKKTSTIIIIVVIAIVAIWAVTGYNGLVSMDEKVSNQWANVETQYQRRADLIPNLVNTVKGYAAHEQETLEGVIEARSKATQIKVDPADLTPEKLAEYQAAQGQLASALGKLLAITENYPDLKQAQLEGTENRINVARKNFNDTAREFNTAIRRFPRNILAGLFGFEKRAYFEAQAGAETAPTVEF